MVARRWSWLVASLLLVPAAARSASDDVPDTSRVFQLGAIEVVALRARGADAVEDRISGAELHRAGRVDVSQALAAVPGITLVHGGSRNEAGVTLRGFDLRQVTLFLDGIPVYVPYDGSMDLGRFTTFDVAQITVSKGFSSILYGPNAMGGAINVVTRRPAAPLELSGSAGTMSSSAYLGDLALGARRARWYAQATGSAVHQDEFPLPSDFQPVRVQPAGARLNSQREDWRVSGKAGFTPNGSDEYALVVASQHGEKGNPPYTGHQPGVNVRYWQWPRWDKDEAYLLTRTALPWKSLLQGRLYYDRFQNELFSYDDSTYTTMRRRSSFKSYYDDPTLGGSLELAAPTGVTNTIRSSYQGKLDQHQEHNAGEPVRHVNDYSQTFALEDTWKLHGPFTAVLGGSWSHRRTLKAQTLVSGNVADLPLGTNAAWNGEGALVWDNRLGSLRGSIARRTRFATMKDRFSFRAGSAIPNPALRPETATHYELAYKGEPLARWQAQAAVFYSRIADLIQIVDAVAVVNGTSVSQTQNVGDARSAGFELGFAGRPLARFSLGASYSFVDRRNLDAPSIKPVDTPRHGISAYAAVTPLPWLDVQASVAGYGPRYTTSNGLTLPPFVTVDLRGCAKLQYGVTLEAGVANLLDTYYELDEGFPEPGRTYFTNLRFAFAR
jgi:iron complex outermembrane receptor protein